MKNTKTFILSGLIASGLLASSFLEDAHAGDRILKQGSYGKDVKILHEQLNKLGFKVSTSTYFSASTADAVKRFQKANHLKPDGVVGPKTKVVLSQKMAELSYEKSKDIKIEKIEKVTVSYHRLLKEGMRGKDILQLKKDLGTLGFSVSSYQSDLFDSETKKQVMRFQESKGLLKDGIVGPHTKTALIKELKKKESSHVNTVSSPFSRTLSLYSKGKDVQTLHKYLNDLGYKLSNPTSDLYTLETKNTVIQFQKDHHLKVDGIAGKQTFEKLLEQIKVKSSSKKVVPTSTPTLNENKTAPITGATGNVPTTSSQNSSPITDSTKQIPVSQNKEVQSFYMTGRGWGHSVGMTQWGAKGMAEQGYSYQDILKYYYTGVDFATKDTSKQNIRVALSISTPTSEFSSSQDYRILDKNTKEVLLEAQAYTMTSISYSNSQFIIKNGDKEIRSSNDLIIEGFSTIFYKGYRYYGTIEVSKNSSNTMDVINHVNVEIYLRGVIPHEISPTWPKEAIKAQILAARTYALKRIQPNNKFDVYDNVRSQVYKGANIEDNNVNRYIEETKGQVIVYKGQLIEALYSASAGGHTVDAEDVWGYRVPYLIGKPDPYDKSRYMENWWRYAVTVNDLSRYFPELGKIKKIQILETKYNRPTKIKVVGEKGEKIMSGYDFRNRVGYDKIQSSIFTIEEIY